MKEVRQKGRKGGQWEGKIRVEVEREKGRTEERGKKMEIREGKGKGSEGEKMKWEGKRRALCT